MYIYFYFFVIRNKDLLLITVHKNQIKYIKGGLEVHQISQNNQKKTVTKVLQIN